MNVAEKTDTRPSAHVASALPGVSRTVDRLQWLVIYRGMRRARSHAVNWINKGARTPKGCVAAPRRLARNILTVLHAADADTTAMIREFGVAMQFTLRGGNHVYSLKLLPEPEGFPNTHDLAWGLACVAELVAHRSLGNDPSGSFHRNTQPLFRAFGWHGWHQLHTLIADSLVSAWADVCPELARDLLRERFQRFKKMKAAANTAASAQAGTPGAGAVAAPSGRRVRRGPPATRTSREASYS